MPRKPSLLVVCFLLLAATALVFSSCSREGSVSSPTSGSTSATSLSPRNSNDVALTMRIQNAHTPDLMKIPDVVGTGTGVGSDGKLAVLVLTRHSGVAGIPGNLDGIKTDVRVVGDVIPYAPPGSGGIQAGNSVGNDRECAAGTIGAVVLKGGTRYLLSNNHVFARENAASIGEREDSPGRYDAKPKCASSPQIGTLAQYQNINFGGNNTVDCALAQLTGTCSAVQSGGYTPTNTVVAPTVGLAVKKSGRTSGLTHGTIAGINVTINVGYSAGTATFVNQIYVASSFIRSGDSGSLMVTESGNNPVGLNFAGGSGSSFATPIGPLLQALGSPTFASN